MRPLSHHSTRDMPKHADAEITALAAKIGPAWQALCVADDGPARAQAGRSAQRRVGALAGEFDAVFAALLASRPASPEGKAAKAGALAPHYQPRGGQSDAIVASLFRDLGVPDADKLFGFGGTEEAQAARRAAYRERRGQARKSNPWSA